MERQRAPKRRSDVQCLQEEQMKQKLGEAIYMDFSGMRMMLGWVNALKQRDSRTDSASTFVTKKKGFRSATRGPPYQGQPQLKRC